ncbi:MAG: substrate-binding domain-containing protein [Capsulimonadaceae bacterium]|nr:substrate-binding domain-containing protein [Capsulimonadaceae bacterium]
MANGRLAEQNRAYSAPAYKRIEDDLRARIRGGIWPVGKQIPGRRELAKVYNVELNTLQRAITNLVADGTLRAESGRGTFVQGDDAERSREPAAPVARTNGSSMRNLVLGIVGEFDLRENASRFANTWNDTIITNIEQVLNAQNASIRYANLMRAGIPVRTLFEAVGQLRQEGVQAVAVSGFYTFDINQAVWDAMAAYPDVPLVFVASRSILAPVRHVYYDNRTAGFQAASHLIEQGCREALFLSPYSVDWVEERFDGAREAFALAGAQRCSLSTLIAAKSLDTYVERTSVVGDLRVHEQAAYEQAMRYFEGGGRVPDAVIAANDWVAFGYMRAAEEKGLLAGREYAIIGFDDHPRSRQEGLTSMRPPLEALGREVGGMLLAAAEGRTDAGRLCLHFQLSRRSSTQMPAAYRR